LREETTHIKTHNGTAADHFWYSCLLGLLESVMGSS